MELFWPLQDGSREEKYFKPLSFFERKELTWLQHMQVNITLKYEQLVEAYCKLCIHK